MLWLNNQNAEISDSSDKPKTNKNIQNESKIDIKNLQLNLYTNVA